MATCLATKHLANDSKGTLIRIPTRRPDGGLKPLKLLKPCLPFMQITLILISVRSADGGLNHYKNPIAH